MRWFRPKLTFANVTSVIALFVALGGVSYATMVLPKNSVGAKQLKKSSVTSPKVADGSLQASDFKAGTLLTGPQGAQGPQGIPGPVGPSTGPAGGDLTGSYPNPTLGNGVVTPSKFSTVPAVEVTNSTTQSIASGGLVPLTFGLETFDTAGLHSAAEPTRLKAPIAGIYEADAHASFDLNATGLRGLVIGVNGNYSNPIAAEQFVAGSTAAFPTPSVSGLVKLNAGDYLEAVVSQTSGVSLSVLGPGNFSNAHFSMHWVGPAT